MKKQDPFLVTPAGGSKFWVARGTGDKVGKFLMMGMNAGNRVVLRLAGGCGQMEPEERIAVVGSMVPEFDGYTGVLFTGATREVNDGVLNPMITDVPGMVAEKNPIAFPSGQCRRLGRAIHCAILRACLFQPTTNSFPHPGFMHS